MTKTEVIFDYYFADVSEQARKHNLASIAVSEQIQAEDVAICESVQRGLEFSRVLLPAGSQFGAKRENIFFTGCCMRIWWPALLDDESRQTQSYTRS